MTGQRSNTRTKTLRVTPLPTGGIAFEAELRDESAGGHYESPQATSALVHCFVIEGTAAGEDLRIQSIQVRAVQHPFRQCPFVLPRVQDLVGVSLLSGWRRTILDSFRGTAGCTHVTTLLLGLSEVTTLVYFQQMNELASYGPETRASGEWLAGGLSRGQRFDDACHVLAAGGPVLSDAEDFRNRRDSATP
jgi:hypothetical protein